MVKKKKVFKIEMVDILEIINKVGLEPQEIRDKTWAKSMGTKNKRKKMRG